MPYPDREQGDDEGVLRTDGSVDQTAAYTSAEHAFDPAHPQSALPRDDGSSPGYTHKKGGVDSSGDKQSHQLETSTSEDPSQAVHDADPSEA